MSLNKGVRIGAGLAVVALTAAACSGSSGSSPKGTGATGNKGGTLTVLLASDFDHLDPQRNYVATSMDFDRLITRQLTTYKAAPGSEGTQLAPDLATDLGKATDDSKTWTFHLKKGLKYEDGTPITSQDVKYGVERSFSPLIDAGPQYAKQFLVGGTAYKGPYSGQELDSIETPDDSTIVFKLKSPHGDFNYTTALPTFTPVPKAKDTKVNYDLHPVSMGPYKILSYSRGKQITLVRNENWDKSSDQVRKALPDKIVGIMGLDPTVIDKRLISSTGPDAAAVQLDASVQSADVAAVLNNPIVKQRSVSGTTGFLRYIAMNTTKGATKNVKVRQALEWAINKTAQQTARGGKNAAGDLATTILAPTVQGHEEFDAYPAGPTGNPAKAKELLAAAGYPNGFSATLETTTTPKGRAQAEAFQADMAKIGVKITINAVDQGVYYDTIGDIKKEPEFVIAAWGPDWPAASTVIPPLFDGRQIVPTGNQNFAQLNDPTINAEIDRIGAISDANEANKAWGALDKKLMTDYAPIFPLLNDKAIFIAGKDVKGHYIQGFYGAPDLVNLSVK